MNIDSASRYRKKPKDMRTLEQKSQAIREQMELDALLQQQRAQRMRGMVGAVRGAVTAATSAGPEGKTTKPDAFESVAMGTATGVEDANDASEPTPPALLAPPERLNRRRAVALMGERLEANTRE